MKILNIHGFGGDYENPAYNALKRLSDKHDFKIVSPNIDYKAQCPSVLFNKLGNLVYEHSPSIVVGTSLGGFYSAILCAKKRNIPTIFVNPCLMPFLYLPRLGFENSEHMTEYIGLFSRLSCIKESPTSTIIGSSDEIITDLDFTRNLLSNERFKEIQNGKHSGNTLPLVTFFDDNIAYFKKLK